MSREVRCSNEISIDELVKQLENPDSRLDEHLTVVYKVKSDNHYYAILGKSIGSYGYGFFAPSGLVWRKSYEGSSVRESIESAIKGGKKLQVFRKSELHQLFK